MTSRRLVLLAALVLAATVLPAAPALAAPPANDNFEGSVVIDPADLPYEATVDTTEATNTGADLEAGALCDGPPATDAGVWYSITTTEDTEVLVFAEGSDYTTGVIVLTGEPGSFVLDGCRAVCLQLLGGGGCDLPPDDHGRPGRRGRQRWHSGALGAGPGTRDLCGYSPGRPPIR